MSGHELIEEAGSYEITLRRHAQISALVAEGSRSQAQVLSQQQLTEAQWIEASQYWMQRLGNDALEHGADAQLPIIYSQEFAAAQDMLAAVHAMTPEEYAELVVAIQRAGSPAEPLAQRALSTADFMRQSRHLARLFASEPEQQALFFARFQTLQTTPLITT